MDRFLDELKLKIIKTLNLTDVRPADIDADDQIVGGVLGIDSIDILDLVMMIEEEYSVRIDSKELGVKVFASFGTLAEYIRVNLPRSGFKTSDRAQ